MRSVLIPIALVTLAACAGLDSAATDSRAREEAACTAVIAAHIGRPPAEVTSRWISEAGGVAKVEARDDDRIHICDISSTGQVLGYVHPEV